MKIDSIKTNLRNIVLLAKEYKEKVSSSDFQEARRIQEKVDANDYDEEINPFEKSFLEAIHDITRTVLRQIDYFSKKILDEFAKPDRDIYDIDKKKVKKASKQLSKKEYELLGSLYEMQVNNHYKGVSRKGKYKEVDIEEIIPELNKFVGKAATLSS